MTISKPFFTKREQKLRFEAFAVENPAIGSLRFVTARGGAFNDVTINADGQIVTFKAAAFDVQKPTYSEDQTLSMGVQLGRVGTDIKSKLKAIRQYMRDNVSNDPVTFKYYEFLYGDYTTTSALDLWVSSVAIEGNSVAISASDDNPNFIGVSERYLAQNWPGLKVII